MQVLEVGPRDGLQNIDTPIDTETKVALVNALLKLGFDRIEAVSFVHPRAVPQMADAEAVMAGLERGDSPTRIVGLVPNVRGVRRALNAGVDELNFVLSATESQDRWNLNRSLAGSLALLEEALALSVEAGVAMRVTISTAFGCPYEGHVPEARVLDLAARCADLGASEICLGDTTGMANPLQVRRLFSALEERLPRVRRAVHLHNTRGTGAANLLAAMATGVDIFDASLGGLGGCPFAPGATGNVCTEDMVHMLHGMDVATGVDLVGLMDVARAFESRLGMHLPGQLLRAGPTLDGVLA
jgi:hydroxymethylglutaryl-CoA lyase